MRVARFVAIVAVMLLAVGCAGAPSRSGLVTKLEQRNGLTENQATCVANGLYDGMPNEEPAIRALTTSELQTVAKPENAGKVPADVTQVLRKVVTACVPSEPQPISP